MSFVICICGTNFSVMMSDGRMVKIPENTVVREDFPKVIKINNNVALAYTGDPVPTRIAIDKLSNYDIENLSLETIESIIIQQLKMLNLNILGVRLIFSGKDKENKFVIHVAFSNNNFEIDKIYPSIEGITYACSGNNEALCNSIIQRNFYNARISTAEQLEHLMSKCIYEVAEFDETVNTNIFKVVIK